ncbi:MAG: hypothetical protein LW817_05995 [Candidatus Caenarcaniphilales bacterium]|jgi:hypothetical protein|nr:hypothetical protein [Candidatus Caenarcaniphilales bacterium]
MLIKRGQVDFISNKAEVLSKELNEFLVWLNENVMPLKDNKTIADFKVPEKHRSALNLLSLDPNGKKIIEAEVPELLDQEIEKIYERLHSKFKASIQNYVHKKPEELKTSTDRRPGFTLTRDILRELGLDSIITEEMKPGRYRKQLSDIFGVNQTEKFIELVFSENYNSGTTQRNLSLLLFNLIEESRRVMISSILPRDKQKFFALDVENSRLRDNKIDHIISRQKESLMEISKMLLAVVKKEAKK